MRRPNGTLASFVRHCAEQLRRRAMATDVASAMTFLFVADDSFAASDEQSPSSDGQMLPALRLDDDDDDDDNKAVVVCAPPPAAASGSCPICWEDNEAALTRLGCGHAYCAGCLRALLWQHMSAGELAEVRCPGCPSALQFDDVTRFAGAEQLARFERLCLAAFVAAAPAARWCPHRGCLAVNVVRAAEPPAPALCSLCRRPVCSRCGASVVHVGACQQRQDGAAVDVRTRRQLLRMGVQPCPGCGVATLRTAGCREMTCRACGRTWHWAGDPDETRLERWALIFPRLVAYLVTSADAHELGPVAALLMGCLGAFVGLPLLPLTLFFGLPALLLRYARLARRTVSHFYEDHIIGD